MMAVIGEPPTAHIAFEGCKFVKEVTDNKMIMHDEYSEELRQLVGRCLKFNPEDRIGLDDLETAVASGRKNWIGPDAKEWIYRRCRYGPNNAEALFRLGTDIQSQRLARRRRMLRKRLIQDIDVEPRPIKRTNA